MCVFRTILALCSKCGPWTSSSGIPSEFVRNAVFQPAHTQWITICILTRFPAMHTLKFEKHWSKAVCQGLLVFPVTSFHQLKALEPSLHRQMVINYIWYTVCVCVLSRVWFFATPWSVAHQALLSMGFPRQEYLSGLPFPLSRDLVDSGMEPMSLVFSALAGVFFYHWATWEAQRKGFLN